MAFGARVQSSHEELIAPVQSFGPFGASICLCDEPNVIHALTAHVTGLLLPSRRRPAAAVHRKTCLNRSLAVEQERLRDWVAPVFTNMQVNCFVRAARLNHEMVIGEPVGQQL